MNIDEIIKGVEAKSQGRTRYEGQKWFTDEVLVAEIKRLRAELDAAKAAIVEAHLLLDKAGLPNDDADWKEWISRFDTWVAKYRTAKENPIAAHEAWKKEQGK